MTSDPGLYFRLTSAIDATLDRVQDKTMAARAFTDAYIAFRVEAQRVAEERDVSEEFQRLFPELQPIPASSVSRGFDPIAASSAANDAQGLLARLRGWLGGFVDEIRLEAESQAYASARMRNEGA